MTDGAKNRDVVLGRTLAETAELNSPEYIPVPRPRQPSGGPAGTPNQLPGAGAASTSQC